ncbi:MAG: NADH:ubiquinone oxidoreductase subunit C [Actinobacteria bacterium]|nr:NADH:ubiquinone oxidoreductase subunit C [Actinomycetota bacterium]
MSSKALQSFVFAFGMCVVCALLLTGAAMGLKDRQDQNKLVDQQKNILKALGELEASEVLTGEEIMARFQARCELVYLSKDGRMSAQADEVFTLPLYLVREAGEIQKYGVPFKAYGLWSWIYGYIALDGGGDNVIGFTVYQHAETPGLGAECEKPWFQNQFKGKRITDQDGDFVSIWIAKGAYKDEAKPNQYHHYIDGMSGATITSKGIEKHLKKTLSQYEPFSKALREQ